MTNKDIIIAYKECTNCMHFNAIDKYYMKCTARNKKYLYGQWVPCEDKKPLELQLLFEQKQREVKEKIVEEECGENFAPQDSAKSIEKPKKKRKKKDA